jgi:MFS family permease
MSRDERRQGKRSRLSMTQKLRPRAVSAPELSQSPATQAMLGPLMTAIGSVSVMGLASGLTLPLVSLRLLQAGASAASIAAMAALPAVGTIGVSLCLAQLTRLLGSKALLIGAMLLSCASLLVLATPFAVFPWALSRLLMGVSTGILFALGEARILEVSGEDTRGRWTGVYAMTLTACQFAGPALLAAFGTSTVAPIVIAAALHLLAIVLLFRSGWRSVLSDTESPMTLLDFLRHSTSLAVAVLFFAMFDSAMLSLLPVYGLKIGLATSLAVFMVSVLFLGDACLQVPIGWAADRFGRRRVHAACGGVAVVVALALPLGLVSNPALWPALFLIGAAAGGLYTLAIVRIGDRFRGGALITANAFVGILWGVGGLLGPVLGSASMEAVNPQGLMLFVAAGALAFLLSMLRRSAHEGPGSAE